MVRRQRNTRRALPNYEEVIADMLTDFSRDLLKFFLKAWKMTRTTLYTFFGPSGWWVLKS